MRLVPGGMMIIRPCNILHGSTNNLLHSPNYSPPPQSVAIQDERQLKISTGALQQHSLLKGTSTKQSMKLPEKWMEYQGLNNWEGFLDPLDEGLRDEILRYGEFVEAAYRACDLDTSSPSFADCRYPTETMLDKCGLGHSGYKVIKDLQATCAVQVPRWTKHVPSWISKKSSWIGYVAICEDKERINMLGRREVVIAYRGTATCLEWLTNLCGTLTCLPQETESESNQNSMVQSGFLSLFTSCSKNYLSLQSSVRDEVEKILQTYGDEALSITITGHSLGAALATLTAYDIATTFKDAPLVTVISFGGPRVGNRCFRSQLEKSGTKVLRIVNSDDPVTKLPGFVLDEDNVNNTRNDTVRSGVANWLQTQFEYAEVGKELRLNSKDCPHVKKGGVTTCHDLKTYLHLLNHLSSSCPIRATAKKMLQRAKHEKQLLFS